MSGVDVVVDKGDDVKADGGLHNIEEGDSWLGVDGYVTLQGLHGDEGVYYYCGHGWKKEWGRETVGRRMRFLAFGSGVGVGWIKDEYMVCKWVCAAVWFFGFLVVV